MRTFIMLILLSFSTTFITAAEEPVKEPAKQCSPSDKKADCADCTTAGKTCDTCVAKKAKCEAEYKKMLAKCADCTAAGAICKTCTAKHQAKCDAKKAECADCKTAGKACAKCAVKCDAKKAKKSKCAIKCEAKEAAAK